MLFVIPYSKAVGQKNELFSIETGICFLDLVGPQKSLNQQFTEANWEGIYQGVPLYIAFTKNLNPSFSGIVRFETAIIDSAKYNAQPFMIEANNQILNPVVWNIYTGLRYNLSNGYILPEESWFNLHLEGGLGNTFFNNRSFFSSYTGFGIEFRSNVVGVFTNAGYNYMTEWDDYFSFELGLRIAINSNKKDKSKIAEEISAPMLPKPAEEMAEVPNTNENNNAIEFEPYLNNSVGSFNTMSESMSSEPEGQIPIQDPVQNNTVPQPGFISPQVSNQRPVKTGPPLEKPDILDPPKPFQRIQSPKSVPLQRRGASNLYHYYFDTDSYQIPDNYINELQDIADQLKEIENLYVRIYGHTDNMYSRDYNLQLSEDRAFEIQKALVNMGVNFEKIKVVRGFGEDKPVVPNDTEENRMLNRRVEVELFTL